MTTFCPSCGKAVDDDPEFCPFCKTYLGWDRTAGLAPVAGPGPTLPSASPAETPAPAPASGQSGAGPSVGAAVNLSGGAPSRTGGDGRPVLRSDGETLHVEPGQAVETTVEVSTTGDLVDEIHLQLTGPAASFGVVMPPVVRLYPGTSQNVVIRFAPPHGSSPRAGSHAWVLQATSPIHGGATRTVGGSVEVGVLASGHVELKPLRSEGRGRHFTHQLVLTNRGNAPWPAQVSVDSDSTEMTVTGPGGPVQVEPGVAAELPLTGEAVRHWFGGSRSLGFDVHVDPGSEQPPQPPVVAGTRVQRALLPIWLVALVPVIVGLAIAAYAVFGGNQVTVPGVAGQPLDIATKALTDAGFVVTTLPVPDSTVEKGKAIGTEPPGGTKVDPGFAVTLKVSTGPAVGDIAIPPVAGKKKADAVAEIERAGLKAEVQNTPSSDVAKGVVIRTDPAAGIKVARDFPVAVYVSTGAPPVTLPDLEGKALGDAQATLQQLGLKTDVNQVPSDSVAADSVIRTEPAAGASVPAGSSVTLVVSSGPKPPVTVPDVTGQSSDTAQATLQGLGLEVKTVDVPDAAAPAGEVVGTVPPQGEEVSDGATVTLQVSSGPSAGPDALLGSGLESPDLTAYVTEHGGDVNANPITLDNGVQLQVAPPGTVTSVLLSPQFDGTLPAGLAWDQTVDEVSAILGTPTSLSPTGPAGQTVGAWDVPFDPVVGVVITFDPDSGHPQTIQFVGANG